MDDKKDVGMPLEKSKQNKEESLEKRLEEACKKLQGKEPAEKGFSEAFRKKVIKT